MSTAYTDALHAYYYEHGIHPLAFNCCNQAFCRDFAQDRVMTEAKMSMVGSRYGTSFPQIVVLSLDPPSGNKEAFASPQARTTEYIRDFHEAEDYTLHHPNGHWAMTQIIVKDILCLFGYQAGANAAVVRESYANKRPIENVSAWFAHVNVAKCSMNHPDRSQASEEVHEICSTCYLSRELDILRPDILVSQGLRALEAVESLFLNPVRYPADSSAFIIRISDHNALWLPMNSPPRQTGAIRMNWPGYKRAIQDWAHYATK